MCKVASVTKLVVSSQSEHLGFVSLGSLLSPSATPLLRAVACTDGL